MNAFSQSNSPVWMARENWAGLPEFTLPPAYSVKWHAPGDQADWLRIQSAADPLAPFEAQSFSRIFGNDFEELTRRQCFLLDPTGRAIGTATAWLDENFEGKSYGRLHWVAIVPEMQGRGLAKPLLSIACRRLIELGHPRACLKTSLQRLPAICLYYYHFGFRPLIRNAQDAARWDAVELKKRSK